MKLAPIAGILIASLVATVSAATEQLLRAGPAVRAPAPDPAAGEEESLPARVRATLLEQRHHLTPGTLDAIRIDARRDVVRLQGDVATSSDRLLILVLTRSVEGVNAVRNELTVSSEEPPPHAVARS